MCTPDRPTFGAVLLFAIALYTGAATAGGGPPNFTCDASHPTSPGAVYKNLTINLGSACTVRAMSITVQGNLADGGVLNVSGFGTVHVDG